MSSLSTKQNSAGAGTTGRLFTTALFLTLGLSIISPAQIGSSVAYAALRAETSSVLGIEIPGGAVRFTKADAPFNGILKSVAGEQAINRKPTGKVEVFAWQGANYREDRASFMRTSVKRALTGAGYTWKEISGNDIRDTNIFNFIDTEDEKLPFRPAMTKQTYYFQATNEARGVSVLGMMLESENSMALAVLPVEFKSTKPVPLPTVSGANVILVKDFNNSMKGVAADKMPAFEPIAKKPRTVRGLVKDSGGKPIAGAQIAVYSSVGGGVRTTHKARSNAQGLYEVQLPAGVAEIAEGKCNVTYNGVNYELPLQLVSGEPETFSPVAGRIEHFVLRTTSEYGGTVRALLGRFEKGTVEITLTPVGRMMDGSAGKTFVYRYDVEGNGEKYLNGMPLGRYKLTARLLDEGDALPIQVRRTSGTDAERELADSLEVNFLPGYTYSQANPGQSNRGVAHFEVALEP